MRIPTGWGSLPIRLGAATMAMSMVLIIGVASAQLAQAQNTVGAGDDVGMSVPSTETPETAEMRKQYEMERAQRPTRRVFLFNMDVPPALLVKHPSPSYPESKLWRLIDQEFSETRRLNLVDRLEEADYRVTMECAGVRYCSKVQVTVQDMDRNILSTHRINARQWVGPMNLNKLAAHLVQTLEVRIDGIEDGATGDFGMMYRDSQDRRRHALTSDGAMSVHSLQPNAPSEY